MDLDFDALDQEVPPDSAMPARATPAQLRLRVDDNSGVPRSAGVDEPPSPPPREHVTVRAGVLGPGRLCAIEILCAFGGECHSERLGVSLVCCYLSFLTALRCWRAVTPICARTRRGVARWP